MHVAPRVGAWIETSSLSLHQLRPMVAPRVGAWIETSVLGNFFTPVGVAPRVGAWIETSDFNINTVTNTSHPVWVRGLKLLFRALPTLLAVSHPVWVRGLKHNIGQLRGHNYIVAPRVGAWIETLQSATPNNVTAVAPRVGAWIETVAV